MCLATVTATAVTASGQFTVRELNTSIAMDNHWEAYQWLISPGDQAWLDAAGFITVDEFDEADAVNVVGSSAGTYEDPALYPDWTPFEGGEDYAVEARAIVTIPAGTWSIGFGSDDGGQLTLQTKTGSNIAFSSTNNANIGFQQAILAPSNQVWYNGNRGHGWTTATFTVAEPTTAVFHSSFHERGGGDSFEVAVAEGAQTFNAGTWSLLQDGSLGWGVSPTNDLPNMLGGFPKAGSGKGSLGAPGIQQTITPVSGVVFHTTGDGATTQQGLNEVWVDFNNAGNLVGNLQGLANAANPRVNFVNADGHWGGNGGTVDPQIPNYPQEIIDSAVFGGEAAGGNIESYTVWSSGEINFPAGITKLRYAVDDYKYLAIDTGGNGVAGDEAGEVLLDDNTWVNRFGGRGDATENNMMVAVEFANAGWYHVEAIMAEGGGGDSAVLYWDEGHEDIFPHTAQFDNVYLQGEGIDPGEFAIPADKMRSVSRGDFAATPFSLKSALNGVDVNLEVSSDLVDADHVVLTSTVAPTEIDLDGANINISVSGGDLVSGDEFVLFVADTVSNAATANWNWPAGTTAADWDISQLVNGTGNRIRYGSGSVVGDCNGDGVVNAADLACACASGNLDNILAATGLVKGDFDGNGKVEFADFLKLSSNFNKSVSSYTDGDTDCSGTVNFSDFLVLSSNFGKSGGGAAAAVPEPSSFALIGIGSLLLGLVRRRRS